MFKVVKDHAGLLASDGLAGDRIGDRPKPH